MERSGERRAPLISRVSEGGGMEGNGRKKGKTGMIKR